MPRRPGALGLTVVELGWIGAAFVSQLAHHLVALLRACLWASTAVHIAILVRIRASRHDPWS